MTQVLENDNELYVTTNCNLLFEKFSDKKAQKTIVNLIGLGILVNRYQSGSQSRDLDRSDRNNKTDEDQTDEDHSNEEVKNSPINKTDEDHSNDPFTKKKAATNKKPKSSTYFSDEFRSEAGKAHSTKTNQASELNTKEGEEECIPVADVNSTNKPQWMAVSKTFNKTFNNKDVKLQPNKGPLHFGFELHATREAQRDGPSDGHRGGGRNGGRGKFNRGGRGNSGSRGRGRGEVSQAGKKRNFSGCYRVNAQQISGSTSMDYDPLQTTRQSNNSKNGYSTSRGTKNVKEDCIRFGGKEYIAVNGDKRNQESRGFRGHKPEICDPQYQIRSSSSRAYYARMNRLDESLRCGEASMSAIAYNEANISGSTWMDNEQSYVLGDLYG